MAEVMLFPLSSIVLPEGKMRLRIFEPRYKRLVSQAMKSDGTFSVCLFDKTDEGVGRELSKIGTLVKIVDFELLDDGLLGISVTGIKKLFIDSIRVEFDGLRYASVSWLPSWEVAKVAPEVEPLCHYLDRVYQQFPDIGDLYQQKFFDDASWVSQRWLEILPLTNQQLDQLAMQPDCSTSMAFLKQALMNEATK
ncbi:ATP-dependent protease [Vibrio galatheae]|uniref:ATP-dependent protease n=1 Tax=Vibrio galatheae TaxID=579748 RepID=A0A0F4NGK7_9VIBR|nr:LON peptidase substrate-binding domain-containing protein [Vibrio galatheae]KJY82267.1 ATP-dependent protease [Vibrio galatheae]